MNRNKRGNNKVFITWLIAYASLFLVLLCLWGVIVSISRNIVEKQNYRINENTINMLVSSIDDEFSNVKKVMKQLGINKQVTRKSYHQSTNDGFDAYTSKEILEEFLKSKLGNNYISDIFLYLPEVDNIISSSSSSSFSIYYNDNYSNSNYSQYEITKLLSKKNVFDYKCISKNGKVDSILIMQTVPSIEAVKSDNKSYATLAVKMEMNHIVKLIEEFSNANQVEINLYAPNGDLLVTTGNIGNQKIAKTITVCSSQNDWKYEMNVPSKVYLGETYYLIIFMIIALLISIAVYCLLSIYFAKRNYSPLKNLMDCVNEYQAYDTFDGSEYTYLYDSFQKIVSEQKQDKKKLAEQLENIRTTYICKFLTGGIRRSDLDSKVYTNLQLEWLLNPCYLLLIKPNKDFDSNMSALEIAYSLHIGKLKDDLLDGYSVILNKMLVVIVRKNDDAVSQKQELIDYCNYINSADNSFYVAISHFDNNKTMGVAFDEAVCSIRYLEYLTDERIMFYEDIPIDAYPKKYAYVEEGALAFAIKNNDKQEVMTLMSHVWNMNTSSNYMKVSDLRFLLEMQLGSYFKTVCTLFPEFYRNGFPVDFNYLSQVSDKTQMTLLLQQVIDSSFDKMSAYSINNKDERFKLDVFQYIEDNFKDSNLTVEKICRDFGKSPSYFSKVFKNTSSEGVLYYINNRRIQEAKYLIKNYGKEMNVNDVYEKVGFTNVNTFIRSFKKYEGMTPGSYKEMVQEIEREQGIAN